MHVQVVDPSAYTPPYAHALCSALGRLLLTGLGVAAGKVHVIHHGALAHAAAAVAAPLPGELADVGEPVVLFFGLLRPYKGLEALLRAWQGVPGAELWIVGRPMMDV